MGITQTSKIRIIKKGENKMIIEKKISVELTPQEVKIFSDCEELIDKFLDQMEKLNVKGYCTDYDYFKENDLEELARTIHSLKTVFEAD